jgi:hypothetical protein
VHFDQHRHSVVACAGLERRHARVVERGDDQQDRVGAERARFGDLIRSTMKSLRSAGSAQPRARRQEFRRALEIRAIGQHRQARGAAAA